MYLILGSTRSRFMESHSDQHHFDVHLVPPLGNFRFYWSKWMGKHGLSRDFLVADRIHSAANRLLALQLLPKIHQSDKECDHHWCHSVQCQINCCSTTTEFRQPFSFLSFFCLPNSWGWMRFLLSSIVLERRDLLVPDRRGDGFEVSLLVIPFDECGRSHRGVFIVNWGHRGRSHASLRGASQL